MTTGYKLVLVALAMLALGAATRFYRLSWSMQGDEPSSFEEARSLLNRPFFMSQPEKLDRLPRANPLGYALLAAGYRLFGTDEAGARTMPALAGALAVAAIVLFTGWLYGLPVAIIVGGLLLLWPWQIFHSQNNRSYSFAFLLASTAMLSGALAWRGDSRAWAVFSGLTSALAVSCHNTTILVPLALTAFAVSERLRRAGPYPARAVKAFAMVAGPLLALSCGLAYLGLRGWGGDAAEGYSVGHTLLGLAYNLTWPVAALSAIGWFAAWRDQDRTWRILALVALAALATACIAPKLAASFRHDYLFAASAAFVLLAAKTVAEIARALAARSRALAGDPPTRYIAFAGPVAVVLAILALALPSVASYYRDGDRPDYRAAAACIRQHRAPGDLVAGSNSESLEYYLHERVQTVSRPEAGQSPRAIDEIQRLTSGGRRLWLVWHYSRNELPEDMDRWLWGRAARLLHHKQKRFDYHENVVDVYLFEPSSLMGVSTSPERK